MTDTIERQSLHAFYVGRRIGHTGKLSDVFKPVDENASELWFGVKAKRARCVIGACYVIQHDGAGGTYWLPRDGFADRTDDHTAADTDVFDWQVADRAAREEAAARRAEKNRTTPLDSAIEQIRQARWKIGSTTARRAFDIWLLDELAKWKK